MSGTIPERFRNGRNGTNGHFEMGIYADVIGHPEGIPSGGSLASRPSTVLSNLERFGTDGTELTDRENRA